MNELKSHFLIATPSFVSGAARLLDLYGVYDSYNTSRTEGEADAKALYSDWRIVGQDIFGAMQEFNSFVLSATPSSYSDTHSCELAR
jgi:hypothetical protein